MASKQSKQKSQALVFQVTGFTSLVNIYQKHYAINLQNELKLVAHVAIDSSFTDVEKATFILMASSHQDRLNITSRIKGRSQAISALSQSKLWTKSFPSFEDLYAQVCQTLTDQATGKHIYGIGPLAQYDVAKRIGAALAQPVYPSAYVYLSAGAMKGAKNLFPQQKLPYRVNPSLFQPYFPSLSSLEIEDILCITKGMISNGNVVAQSCSAPKPWGPTDFYHRSMQDFPDLREKIDTIAKQILSQSAASAPANNP